MTIGETIRAARKDKGLKQVELAGRIGMYQVSLARIELGYHSPTFATLERIASGLGMEVVVLLTDKE